MKKNKLRLILIGFAVVVVVMSCFFPLQIQREDGIANNMVLTLANGHYRIVIGNPVSAQDADYICDGVDDHVQFQQAMDALPSVGGQLFVLAGTYNWGANETVTRAIDGVSVIGVGGAVYFNGDDTTPIFAAGGDYWLFSNFQTDAGIITMGSTDYWMQLNLLLGATYVSVTAPDGDLMQEHGNEYHDPDFATQADHSALNTAFLNHSARHENAGADEISVAGLSGLLADAQTALTHAASHQSGGGDAIKLDDLATPDDNTDLDASATAHGLLPKLDNTGTKYLRDDGTWQTIGGGGDMLKSTYDTDDDGLIDTAAGGTEWDSSAQTGFAYITAGVWSVIVTGITDNNVVTIDQADAASGEYTRLTADGIESRSKAETQADLDLEPGVDFPSLATFNDHSARHEDGGADEISLAGLDGEPSTLTTHKSATTGVHGVTGTILGTEDVDDTPVDGETDVPVSSNWAFDHDADATVHHSNVVTITFVIDGGGSEIADGIAGHLEIPFACTLTAWTLLADQSGSIIIDVWGGGYGDFPLDNTDAMPGSGKEPTITTAQNNQDTTITDWTDYTLSAGDCLTFNVDSCTTIERVTLSIKAEKS